jgi:hypothetical protein
MRFRLPLALLLMSAIAVLTPLAYCDLPDQLWLGGCYDGADEDDAIFHIQTHLNAIESPDFYVAASVTPCVPPPLEQYWSLVPVRILSPNANRAPPTS